MLKRIDPNTFEDKIEWLWSKVKEQTYAFDDSVKGDARAFLEALLHPASAHWFNESGMVSLVNIQMKLNADVHFLCWDPDYSKRRMLEDAKQIFKEAFDEFKLVRITATVPHFNQMAAKMALRLGMKWEGAMRSCFLHNGQYYDLLFYGLLREEFIYPVEQLEEVANGRSY
jgi:hypothetical protein